MFLHEAANSRNSLGIFQIIGYFSNSLHNLAVVILLLDLVSRMTAAAFYYFIKEVTRNLRQW